MTVDETTPGTVRPGGRTARTRAAVRDATLAELARHGYQGLTVENVAERSGVHKTTLYRRWGGPDGLVVDALDLAGEDGWRPPDTGTLAGDLAELASQVYGTFTDPAQAAAPSAFVAAAFDSERAAAALRRFYADRHTRSAEVVTRAIRRGELPPDTDGEALVRAVTAPLYFRLFVTREPLDEPLTAQAVAAAVAAARAGVFTSAGGA
ncbi:TetR/AcrR family transcriptional regulator [Crossiella cryophila]